MLLALKDSPLNSAFVVENMCGYFKRAINDGKTKLKQIDVLPSKNQALCVS